MTHREQLPVKKEQKPSFIKPSLKDEYGEIERVSSIFQNENKADFIATFIEKASNTALSTLSEDQWKNLENTDSFDIGIGEWDKVAEHIDYINQETGAQRDWKDIREKMEQGKELDAPIILKYNNTLHLVSGNTRLMVARALGVLPEVLFVEI